MRRERLRRTVVALAVLAGAGLPGALVAQWAARPGTTVRNEFGPELGFGAAACRGACGPDCPSWGGEQEPDTGCEPGFYLECVDRSRFTVVRTYECGTHEGCRVHDDCLDECSRRYPGSTVGPLNFGVGECSRDCHIEGVEDHGLANTSSWARGHGPFDGRIVFEYTKDSPSAEEPLYRCPEGRKLVCDGSGRGQCVPEDEPEEEEPDEDPGSQAIGVFVGPEPACVEEGDSLRMWAEVVGLPESGVRWSVLQGPARIGERSGHLTPTGGGEVTVRAVSEAWPAFFDTAVVTVGGCSCQVSAILSGDTSKTNAQGRVAHFSTGGGATVMGAFTNPDMLDGVMEMFGDAMGEEQKQQADEWRREMARMPRETLGISLSEMDPASDGEELLGQAFGGFKLQASVMDRPIEPGFAGGLPLAHVSLHTGEYTEGGYPTAYEWAPGAPGNVHLIVSHYNGRSLSGTLAGHMFAPGLYKESTREPPQISFSVSFFALEFDPVNMVMGCLTAGQ